MNRANLELVRLPVVPLLWVLSLWSANRNPRTQFVRWSVCQRPFVSVGLSETDHHPGRYM